MPHLAINQPNNPNILALFAVSSKGYLYDPDDIEYIVSDSSGTQVFPSSGREPGLKVDTGVYSAYDHALSAGLTPNEDDYTPGQDYTITWYYTDEDGNNELTWAQTFGVVEEGLGLPFWTYISPQRLRDEWLTEAKMSTPRLLAMIKTAQAYVERRCRQPFRPIRHTYKLAGNNTHTLQFSIPIIGVEYVSIYDTQMDQNTFAVFNIPTHNDAPGWLPEDNRANPKIRISEEPSLFSSTSLQRYGRITGGARNIGVKGVWGCLEPDGTTPEGIAQAMLYMIFANAPRLNAGESPSQMGGVVISETTDRHSIEYAGRTVLGQIDASPFAKSAEAEELLRQWKGPILIEAPTDWITEAKSYGGDW